MKKQDIKAGQIYEQIDPCNHTEKLLKIEILHLKQFLELNKKGLKKQQNYTYIFFKICDGQYYPAKNSTEKNILFLDGLIGDRILNTFKSEFRLID